MSLKFAIIKSIRTQVGEHHEDVVYEYDEENIKNRLLKNLIDNLPFKRTRLFDPKYTEDEVIDAFREAWKEAVEEFKEVTIRIF